MFPGDALPRAGRDSCDGRPPRVHASAKSWSPHPGSALRGCRALGSTRPASGLCPCAPFGPATAGCHLPAPSESSMVHSFHQCIRIFDLRPNLRERSAMNIGFPRCIGGEKMLYSEQEHIRSFSHLTRKKGGMPAIHSEKGASPFVCRVDGVATSYQQEKTASPLPWQWVAEKCRPVSFLQWMEIRTMYRVRTTCPE